MKIAVIVLGVLGGLSCLMLGIYWLAEFDRMAASIKLLQSYNMEGTSAMKDINNLKIASYLLIFGGIISIIVSLMVNKLKKMTGVFLLLFTAISAFFALQALVPCFLLVLAGIFSFFVKPKAQNTSKVIA